MEHQALNFADKLGQLTEQWSPRVIAELNDYQFKLVKLQGEFVWHSHADTDEAFIVLEGHMSIQLRDGEVQLKQGEMYVVPAGVEHKPVADNETSVLLIEPRGVLNTGDEASALTAENDVWL